MTVVDYAEEKLRSGKASSGVVQAASGNVRQYLGGFGLGGKHALRPIGTLSGGERMRLCFATVLADEPHLLILDESTNHLDLETLDALASALKAFQGAVVMVSHNQGFLNGFCQGLWILGENGRIEVRYSDEDETFDDMFTQYRDELFSGSSSARRSSKRQQKANMAKRAANQSANARGHTSLI
jgi:ATPase subunit of ABC transporter with duplicated ATPase domains